MLEDLGALAGIREGEGLAEVLQGGERMALGGEALGEVAEGSEDLGGAHVFVLTAADGIGEASEGGALFSEVVELVAVGTERKVAFAGLSTEVIHNSEHKFTYLKESQP